MAVKAIVTGVLLILMVILMVNFTEYFLPLSVKADLDMLCRSALLRMENAGRMSKDEMNALETELEKIGLTNINFSENSLSYVKQGGKLTLRVEGDYTYNRITSLFKREDVTVHMVYDKTTMSRRLVN